MTRLRFLKLLSSAGFPCLYYLNMLEMLGWCANLVATSPLFSSQFELRFNDLLI